MGHKHTKDEILAAAMETATESGLSKLSYGRVAKRLDISDRIVVYYFPTKNDLVTEVLVTLGLELQVTLAPAFTTPSGDHTELVRRAWPLLARPEADRVFALFFEANGLAVTGIEPYATVVPGLVDAWIEWAAGFIDGRPSRRRAEAEAAIALIDGLLLLRQVGGADAAARAARKLGVS